MRMAHHMPDFMYRYQEGHLPFNNIYDRNDLFNLLNDRETLNRQARLTNEGVNNIVAAYFIKNVQQKRSSMKPVEVIVHKEDSVPDSAAGGERMSDIQADLGGITNNQLNTVNDMMKKIIEKDFTK
jgi:hypothetical protein